MATKINLARCDTNLLIFEAFHGLTRAILATLSLVSALIIQTSSDEELATFRLLLFVNIFIDFLHLKLSIDLT